MQLALILSLHQALDEDRGTPHEERLQRDREIGRGGEDGTPLGRVMHWWSSVGSQLLQAEGAESGARIDGALRVAVTALTALGFALGLGVAGAAFAYHGRYPVNLFALLGVLVVVPWLPFIATAVLLLPLPGVRRLREGLATFSPGRWLAGFLHKRLNVDFLRWRGGNTPPARVAQLEALRLSLWMGVGFFCGALVLALLLVAFTDLAFGWSTTLEVDASLVHGLVSGVSLPWRGWLPVAAPDAELVALSQYFRLENAAPPDVSRLGEWWPFVCMMLLVYGLAPRALLLAWVSWRRHGAYEALLLDHPQVRALLDRMSSPLVVHESSAAGEQATLPTAPDAGVRLTAGGANVLLWNSPMEAAQCVSWLRGQFAIEAGAVLEVGSHQSGQALDQALAGLEDAKQRLVLVTKGWEPPLLEFLDLIDDLRSLLGADVSITVVPVDTSGQAVEAGERDVWAVTLAQRSDPALYVVEATNS
ncbi:MAG: DUF2868 domain-containing protein [Pseudomonadota bacterium]